MHRLRTVLALTLLAVVVGALPALADEEGETPPEGTTEEESAYQATKWSLLLSAEFATPEEDVAALRDLGLGWGDLFRLEAFALALGVDVDTLLAGATVDPETGGYSFDWGALKASLTDEQLAVLGSLPKNFGQVVAAFNRHHGRDTHQPDGAGTPGGKPDHAGTPGGKPDAGKPDHAGKGGADG